MRGTVYPNTWIGMHKCLTRLYPNHRSTYDPLVQDSQGSSTIDTQLIWLIRPIILFMLYFDRNNTNQTLISFLDFPKVAYYECAKHLTIDPSEGLWYKRSKLGWAILGYWVGGKTDGWSFSRWCPAVHAPYPDEKILPRLQEGDMMVFFLFFVFFFCTRGHDVLVFSICVGRIFFWLDTLDVKLVDFFVLLNFI